MTQKQLGDEVVASHSLISFYESGKKKEPPEDLVEAFSSVLGFESEFFYRAIDDVFREVECSFRHRRTTAERLKMQVRAHATLIGMVVDRLRVVFDLPKYNVPNIRCSTPEEIELAAERCRRHWKIGLDSPILQIGRVLEHAGVLILPNMAQSKKIDAFSRCGRTAMIFLNQSIPSTSRWIFDIAHECGHLVIHHGIETGSIETEREADGFASSFLMPRRAFGREFGSASFSWSHIFELKRRWRVSAAAIITRAYHLGLIGAVSYRQAYKYMSAKGWRSIGEPHEPPFQEPELFCMAIEGLGARVPLTLGALCAELNFTAKTFMDVTGVPIPKSKPSSEVISFPA